MTTGTLDSLRPRGWDEYVGQDQAKLALEIMIKDLEVQMEEAMAQDSHIGVSRHSPYVQPVHILIVGPPGTGKTTLSKIYTSRVVTLAKEKKWPVWGPAGVGSIDATIDQWTAGVPSQPYRYAEIEGGGLPSSEVLDAYLSWLQVQGVLFVDEFQDVPPKIHSDFYSIMHDGKWRTSAGDYKRHYGFTLIGATTDDGRIARPLLSRFGLIIRLKPYSEADIEQMITRTADKMRLKLSVGAMRVLVDRGRDNPRTVVQNVDMLKRLLRSSRRTSDTASAEDAEMATRIRDIGPHGLMSKDMEILSLLNQGIPVGAKVIAETLGLGAERNYTDVLEPFLLQRGYVIPTPQGRTITDKGRAVIAEA